MQPIFITGLYRSGTTLVDKLINSSEEAFIASQPFPQLFIDTAQQYLAYKEKSYYPPLNTLFANEHENLNEFTNWLNLYNVSKQECTLIDAYKNRLSNLKHSNKLVIGSKEIVCEQFIPYFLQKNTKVILVYRDPRDVITSLNYGNGKEHMGEIRPTLYNLRQWRKTIAFVLHYQKHPFVHTIRYENLVKDPKIEIGKLSSFLKIKLELPKNIFDQNGKKWIGNSSHSTHGSISNSSVGKYLSLLPKSLIEYIETICYPELRALNYPISISAIKRSIIENFVEPFPITREDFNSNYSTITHHVSQEIERIKCLKKPQSTDNKSLFIYENAYQYLSKLNLGTIQ